MDRNPIVCAVDTPEKARAATLAGAPAGAVNVNLGLELFVANGPAAISEVATGTPLFLDLKLRDAPNTATRAILVAIG